MGEGVTKTTSALKELEELKQFVEKEEDFASSFDMGVIPHGSATLMGATVTQKQEEEKKTFFIELKLKRSKKLMLMCPSQEEGRQWLAALKVTVAYLSALKETGKTIPRKKDKDKEGEGLEHSLFMLSEQTKKWNEVNLQIVDTHLYVLDKIEGKSVFNIDIVFASCHKSSKGVGKYKHCFEITGPQNVYSFAAHTSIQMEEWVSTLQQKQQDLMKSKIGYIDVTCRLCTHPYTSLI